MMDCKLAGRHLWSYLDGELSPQQVLDLEAHFETCDGCADAHDFAGQMKRTVHAQVPAERAPEALRARVRASLTGAQARHRAQAGHGGASGLGGLADTGMSAGLLAVAAVVLLGLFGRGNDSVRPAGVWDTDQASVPRALPSLFRDVVNRHTDQLPTEVESSEPEHVSVWFRGKLGFRVSTVRFEQPDVRLQGARISNVGDQRAARLYYSIGGKRVTAVAFELTPDLRRALAASDTLQRAHVGRHEVSYHTIHGYTVPVIERDGVVYAFTGDLDQSSLLRLVASAQLP